MVMKIKKILKYKLNDLNVKYLLMKDLSNEFGNSLNKKMELFLILICFVFKYLSDEESFVIIRMIEDVFIVICVVILCSNLCLILR